MRFATLLACALAAAPAYASPARDPRFHTSPECWQEARIYHPGPPPAEIANRIHLVETPAELDGPGEPTVSPNGAYRFWVRNPDMTKEPPWGAGLIVDVERDRRPTLLLENVAQPIQPRWLNEKLIFVRVPWGRIVFSDLILDVETRELIYNEVAEYGQLAFEQFKQACAGRCPCEATAGARPLPESRPAEGAVTGLLEMPTIFGPGEAGGVVQAKNPKPVPVYAEPDLDAEIIAHPVKPEDIEYREIGYEAGAAVVSGVEPGWYRVTITGQRAGWIRNSDSVRYVPLADLLPSRLAYLNAHWNGDLWSAPEGDATVRRSKMKNDDERQEYAVAIREVRDTDRGQWLKVGLYGSDPCEGGDPVIVDEGWIPAYSTDGKLVAWYHSRGC